MSIFVVPPVPDHLELSLFSLTVQGDLDLSGDELLALCERAKLEPKSHHASFREEVQIAGKPGELRGLIGIHRSKENETPETDEPLKCWLHYTLTLRSGSFPTQPSEDSNWPQLQEAIAESLKEHTLSVDLGMAVPRETVEPSLKLPIPLSPSELSGFSEIRGVRLVQVDEDERDEELYSLIIDFVGDAIIISVAAPVLVPFDQDVLTAAFGRCYSIASLAIEEVDPFDGEAKEQ